MHRKQNFRKPCPSLPSVRILMDEVDEKERGRHTRPYWAALSPLSETKSFIFNSECSSDTPSSDGTESYATTPQSCVSYHDFFPTPDVDTSDWNQNILAQELRGKSLAEWMYLQRKRDPNRVPYGENLSSGKRKRSLPTASTDSSLQRAPNAEVDHKEKEQDRRKRHAFWQRLSDIQCADWHFDTAQGHMEKTKIELGQAAKTNVSHKQETSKDQQLFATLLHQIMSRWIQDAQEEVHILNTPRVLYKRWVPPVSPSEQAEATTTSKRRASPTTTSLKSRL